MFVRAIIALLLVATTATQAAILERQYGAWKAETEPLTYQGTELYTFMDGGAEVYLEYGFERLESQIYRRGEDEITVELYRMGDGAYGMITFLRPVGAEKIAVGDAAFLSGYYLVFVKGPFLCAVTAQSEFPASREAVLEVAGGIASRLGGKATRPGIFALLPDSERIESTERQLRGPVGLRNSSEKAAGLFTGFSDGAVATYRPDCAVGLLSWNDEADAEQAWKSALGRAGAPSEIRPRVDGLISSDASARFKAARSGAFIVFALGPDPIHLDVLIQAAKAKIAEGMLKPKK